MPAPKDLRVNGLYLISILKIYSKNALLIYTSIHIHRGGWISPITPSILNQFSWNFTHTIFHLCRDYPESFDKYFKS